MVEFFGVQSSVDDEASLALPEELLILKAYPNPFNAEVKLLIQAQFAGGYALEIFDITGRKVRSFETSGRAGQIIWDGRNEQGDPVASGLYFARATSSDYKTSAVKLTLLR
jgi:hypothetical protein